MKICENPDCKKEFEPKNKRQKYCNSRCSDHVFYLKNKEVYINNARRWEKENPEKRKIIMKKSFTKFRTEKRERFNELMRKSQHKNLKHCNTRKFTLRKIKIPNRQICQNCNIKPAIERHHYDYDKPLEILFVCKDCNEKLLSIN